MVEVYIRNLFLLHHFIVEVKFINREIHRSYVYNLMDFEKCIHLHDHYVIEHRHYLRKQFCGPLLSVLTHHRHSHSDFGHQRLALLVPESYKELFCAI